ncbi:MAG: permease [Planctomycetota bacterium]
MILELPTVETLAVTFLVTLLRTIIEASPTLLGGVLVAAYLRTQVEPKKLETFFPGSGVTGIRRAALVATVLPVCSIGVLPVLRELQRMGLPMDKMITIGLVAPLLNPFSILYGLSVLSVAQCLMLIAMTVILAIAIGDVGSRFLIDHADHAAARPVGLTGPTRLRNLFVAASRLITGQSVVDLILVILVSATVTSLIRSGAFYRICEPANVFGPALASLLTGPQYVSPMRGMIQFAGIGNADLSVLTGLAIYLFGTGISAAGLLGLIRWYGLRRAIAFALAMVMIVWTICFCGQSIVPRPSGEVAETSALDGISRPGAATLQRLSSTLGESLAFVDPLVVLSAVAVATLLIAGCFVRIMKIDYRNDDPEAAAIQNAKRMSRAIPASQLGLVAVCGFAVLFGIFIYVIFPGPQELVEQLDSVQVDANIAIRSGKVIDAIDRIDECDAVAAKLPLGAAIRGDFPSRSQQEITRNLRLELRRLRELMQRGDVTSAQNQIPELVRLLTETKRTFAGSVL